MKQQHRDKKTQTEKTLNAVKQEEEENSLSKAPFVTVNSAVSVELLNVPSWIKLLFPSFSMAIKGYKTPLEAKDLWSLNQRDSSKSMVPKLLKEWEKEQPKVKRYVCERGGDQMNECTV